MKKPIASLLLCLLCFFIPIWVLSVVEEPGKSQEKNLDMETGFPGDERMIQVLFSDGVAEMSLHDYLVGTLSAEMPSSYPDEALKAQAIAARTNVLYKMQIRTLYPEEASHQEADICADYTHCQAFATEEEQREKWGDGYVEKRTKMEQAVTATDGVYITYQNRPISALFHAISSGRTEKVTDVWGGDEIPYLVGVESGWDRSSEGYESVTTLQKEEVKATILATYPDAAIPENAGEWVTDVVKSQAGGWINLRLCGQEITGRDFRNLFSLRSTHITMEWDGDTLYLTTHGYGHGVGMSQYGAKCMADEGKPAEEILAHYYPGTTLHE